MTPLTPTQNLGIVTKNFLKHAEETQDLIKTHLTGRVLLLAGALFGTAELIARIGMYCIGQIIALLSFYQSEEANAYVKEQINGGFSAAVIASASLVSLLSPSVFTMMVVPGESRERGILENNNQPLRAEPRRNQEESPSEKLRRKERELVFDIVKLPFEILALTFKIPFYCAYLTFQCAVLPIRIALLPIQLMLCPFTFSPPRHTFQFNLNLA